MDRAYPASPYSHPPDPAGLLTPSMTDSPDRPFSIGRILRLYRPRSSSDMVHEDELQGPQVVDGECSVLATVARVDDQKWTDGRSKLLSELLGSMQIIKVFTYEIPFLKRECSQAIALPQVSHSSAAKSLQASARFCLSEQATRLWHSASPRSQRC